MRDLDLKTKSIIVISTIFLLGVLVMLCSFSAVTTGIVDDFARRVANRQALHDRNKILAIIDREVVLARKMADDALLRKWAVAEDPLLRTPAFEQLESYRRFFRDRSCFIAVNSTRSYYTLERATASTPPRSVRLRPDNPADRWFFSSLKSGDSCALNVDYNTAIRQTKVWINVAMGDDNGAKTAICGSGIDISDFLNEIVNSGETGTSTILVDRRGVIQAHENKRLVERNALERDATKKLTIFSLLDDPAAARQMRLTLEELSRGKQTVAAFPLKINGRRTRVAAAFMPDIGWYTIALVDVSHVLRSTTFLPIILLSVLSLLVVITLIAFFMNRMVLTPLSLLTKASRDMATGNYEMELSVRQMDEIGVLTQSFNSMVATVRNHTKDLEESVRLRTAELSRANSELEASQARIMESLTYARVIQGSILPPAERFDRLFSEWFTLYRPCDIVGGDLYWLREFDDHFLLAIIDCTGHGVPGAFMTMTVNSVLNHVVDTTCSNDPARILAEMNLVLRETLQLRQDDRSLVDAGLDIALCCIEPKQQRLTFTGAGISLYLLSGDELHEIRGDRQGVGYRSSNPAFVYTSHVLDMAPGIHYYAVTDGFLDEGGGVKGYGFGRERFRTMLLEGARHPLARQGELFEALLVQWRGERKQRDDITMVGFRL